MRHAPGLASCLIMQVYLRRHRTPMCLRELLVEAARQRCRQPAPQATPPQHAEIAGAPATPQGAFKVS